MAWLSSTAWTTSDTPVLATVLNNIGLDIRTWGGAVDGGGNPLTNVSAVSVYASGNSVIKSESNTAAGYFIAKRNVVGAAREYWFGCGVDGSTEWSVYDATAGAFRLKITAGGNVGIGTTSPTAPLHVSGLSSYASNAAAISGGLTVGAFYRNGDTVCVVH